MGEGEEATTAPIFQMKKLELRLVSTIPKQGLKPTEHLAPQLEVNFSPETPSLKLQASWDAQGREGQSQAWAAGMEWP